MPRTKGGKNKAKTVTVDFKTQIAERQSKKEALSAEVASITEDSGSLRIDLKRKSIAKIY